MWNFNGLNGSWFLGLEFPRALTLFLGICSVEVLFCLDFPEEKFRGLLKKLCPQTPTPLFGFFLE